MIGFTIAVGAMIYLFKKFGVDLGVVTDALKWAGSWISTLFLKLQQGIYTLLNKIPGMRGDFDNDLKGISEKLEENEKNRGKLEEDMAARRQKNLEDEAKKENSRDERDKKRGERREQREKAAIDRKEKAELGAIGAKEDREKAAAEAKDVSVDMSDPIKMLKTFAAKQKSAYTQEARAIEDKEKSQNELKSANEAYAKAVEEGNKASTEEEQKAAKAKIDAAKARLKKATEADDAADEAAKKAAERMKLAKEGKDPGAVAEGKVKEEKKTESGGASSTGKPASDAKVPPINQDIQKNLEMVKAAMEKRGMTDPKYINATLANVMKETGGKVVEENLNYKNTSNDRIKSIFGSRAAGKSDAELNQIKSDPKQMGEMMYGSTTKIGKQMGNTEPGDGFKYRGRGNVQLTGKSNYAAASKAIYGDNRLVDNPDLVNDPAVAAEVTAWYMQKGQQGMAKSLGINTKNMSQDEANQLATSQIAGRAIKRGEKGYLGEEVLGKVDKFSKDSKIAGIAGAPVSEETKKAMAEGKPKPQDSKTETKPEDAAKARADAAANDPRRTDKPATATAEGKPTTGDSASGSLQGLMKDGIVPTTLAFQDLVNKGIKPFQGMLSGVQVKTPLKGEVPAKESLSPGEELVKATAAAQAKTAQARDPGTGELLSAAKDLSKSAVETNKTKGMYDKDAARAYVSVSDQAKAGLEKEAKITAALAGLEKGAAQARDPGTGELLSAAKDLSKSAEAQLRDPGTGELLSAAKDLSGVVTKQDSSSDQAKAVKDSLIESSKFMFSGFDMFATDLSSGMTKTFDFVGTDLSSTFSDTLKLTMDDSLGLFTTDLSNNFAAFETLDLPSMVTGLDDYTKQIYAASDEIAKGEANIAQQEAAIATASANLQDPSITNKDEIAAAVAAMQDNIQLQKSTIAYNKDVIDKNIMARAETPLTELVAQANKDAQEKIRLAEEAASEKEKQSEATVMASSQEGSGDSASDLNTALAELIAISRKTADLNEKQLSVQSSLSGDLFA
jgi:predicted chitinase